MYKTKEEFLKERKEQDRRRCVFHFYTYVYIYTVCTTRKKIRKAYKLKIFNVFTGGNHRCLVIFNVLIDVFLLSYILYKSCMKEKL